MLKYLLKITVFSLFTIFIFVPLFVQATDIADVISDLDKTAESAKIKEAGQTPQNIYQITGYVIRLVLSALGVLFLILMIYGGITWMTASGNEQKVAKASSLISQAAIGLIIVLAAYLITNFIIFQVISQTTTSPTAENLDQQCLDLGGECQNAATGAGEPCSIGAIDGHYFANLCLSDPSSTYLCCVPDEE